MPQFRYTGRRLETLEPEEGCLQAATPGLAAKELQRRGILPLTIRAEPTARKGNGWLTRPLPAAELIQFSSHMQALTESGVPLGRGLATLAESTRHPGFRAAILAVAEGLQAGRALSASMGDHPLLFCPLYQRIVRIGEETGRLAEAFRQLSRYLETEQETRRLIIQAIRYPLFVLLTIVIALAIIHWLVMPAFALLFQQFRAELPWATRMLLAFFAWFGRVGGFLIWGSVAAGVGITWYGRTEGGALWRDRFFLGLPLVGGILHQALSARFARTMAMALRSGLPAIQAIQAAADAVGNRHFADKIRAIGHGVERGQSLAQATRAIGLFAPMVLQLITVGEETGALDRLLDDAATFLDRETGYQIRTLTAVIEPILIVMIGLLILMLAMGVFLPMWSLGSAAISK